MKIVCSSDWQAQLNNLDRLEILVDHLVELLAESNKYTKTFFIHLGDVKEQFNPLDIRVMNFIITSFERIRKVCTAFYFVRGNHDSITTQDFVPSCAPLIKVLGASVTADKTWEKIAIRLTTLNNQPRYALLYFVPYFRDMTLQKQMFTEAAIDAIQKTYKDPTSTAIGKNNIKLLFFHNTITGSQQSLYTKGDGLTLADIHADVYDTCISGHIHLPQTIGNMTYVGSPMAMDWSEVNFQHRTLTLEIDEIKH
jgi:DNA repair exonuclease SbcCD nuclease subunit